jgi:hypothetical protein
VGVLAVFLFREKLILCGFDRAKELSPRLCQESIFSGLWARIQLFQIDLGCCLSRPPPIPVSLVPELLEQLFGASFAR